MKRLFIGSCLSLQPRNARGQLAAIQSRSGSWACCDLYTAEQIYFGHTVSLALQRSARSFLLLACKILSSPAAFRFSNLPASCPPPSPDPQGPGPKREAPVQNLQIHHHTSRFDQSECDQLFSIAQAPNLPSNERRSGRPGGWCPGSLG